MNLNQLSFAMVHEAIDKTPTGSTCNEFNTSFHSAAEAPEVALTVPSEKPYGFKRWLPLIIRSRNLRQEDVQYCHLSTSQTRLLLQAAEGSIQIGALNRIYAEDIAEEIIPALKDISFTPEGLFLRLDACSPKDGRSGPLHSADDIILQIVTSTRARNAILGAVDAGSGLDLFFIPFDASMRSEKEYRVFCPPGCERITAISQYRWHKPWIFSACSDEEKENIASFIAIAAEEFRREIVRVLEPSASEADQMMLEQGFSFDVAFEQGTEACRLIELNGFGVRGSCGSCLFHWVRDWKLLYGQASEEVEFRVAV